MFSSRGIQNTHLERYLRNALNMGLTKCLFIIKRLLHIHKCSVQDTLRKHFIYINRKF